MAPVSDLGLFGAAGVLFCVSFTLDLLPALLSVIPEGNHLVAAENLHLQKIPEHVTHLQTGCSKAVETLLSTIPGQL